MEEKFLFDLVFAVLVDLVVRFGWYVLTALLSAVGGGLGTLWFGRGHRKKARERIGSSSGIAAG